MLVRQFTSRRSTISLQLLRHYSIKVWPLKKHSLYAQILRRGASPSFSRAAPRGGRLSDGGCKPIQIRASFRSVDKQPPSLVSSQATALENGDYLCRYPTDEDSFSDVYVGFKAEGKEAHGIDGFTCPPLKAGVKNGDLRQPQTSGNRAKWSDGDDACGDAQPLLARQSELSKSEGLHSQAQGRRRRALNVDSCKAYISTDNSTEVCPSGGHSDKFTCSASEVEDEQEKLDSSSVCTIETNAANEGISPGQELVPKNVCKEQSVPKHAQAKQRGGQHTTSLVADTSSRSQQIRLSPESMDVYLANEWRKTRYEFKQGMQEKVDVLCSVTSVRRQVSASPDKLAAVLEVLTEFLGSCEMACRALRRSPGILSQPLAQLQLRLQLLNKFQVDRETCQVAGVSKQMMESDVENYEMVLTFLSELGLSVESRNQMIRKQPTILVQSVEESMRPLVDFLKGLGASKKHLLMLLERKPCLFCSHFERILLPRHSLFQKLGLSDAAFVAFLRVRVVFDMDKISMHHRFLREQGLSEENISDVTRRLPNILTWAPQKMKRNLDYLLHTENRDISDVLRYPCCLGLSLTNRIIPRFKIAEELQVPRSASLAIILGSNAPWLRKHMEEGGSTKL